MQKFSNEVLSGRRSLSQALSDLVSKHEMMVVDHPDRARLRRMIGHLQAELAARKGGAADGADGFGLVLAGGSAVRMPASILL